MTRKEILSWAEETVAKILHPHTRGHKHEEFHESGWVARDKDGDLWLYKVKPEKGDRIWDGPPYLSLSRMQLPSIKWEDEEPTEVTITIKIKEK